MLDGMYMLVCTFSQIILMLVHRLRRSAKEKQWSEAPSDFFVLDLGNLDS